MTINCDLSRTARAGGYRHNLTTGIDIARIVLATIREHARYRQGVDRGRVTDDAIATVDDRLGCDTDGTYRCTLVGAVDAMITDLLEQIHDAHRS